MDDQAAFDRESVQNVSAMSKDAELRRLSQHWIDSTGPYKYVYNWKWLGLPIIQLPADIVVTQEIIWLVKPTLIIETGIARGGSLVFNASQLAVLDLCEGHTAGLRKSARRVVGIDIEIRRHNGVALESHPLAPMITMYEGSSIDETTVDFIRREIRSDDRVLVILDSNHTHAHVLTELELYSGFVTQDSFVIVHDTSIEHGLQDNFKHREWGAGNNPWTAVNDFLATRSDFVVDHYFSDKLLISSSPGGYLRRVR